MSDLQLSLLGIGLLVIVGVVAYNWWQERGYRKMAQQRFHSQHDDVLLRTTTLAGMPPAEASERIEPVVSNLEDEPAQFEAAAEAFAKPAASEPVYAEPTIRHTPADKDAALPPQVDEEIDFVVCLELAEPASADVVREALAHDQAFDKPAHWFGRSLSGEWQAVGAASGHAEFSVVCGALQMADRTGPVSAESLGNFSGLAQEAAAKLLAVAQIPEKQPALERAQALDEFCADVDVLVGVNVVATGQDQFQGTKLRALAEASGLKLASDGTFQYRDDRGVALYSLTNHESAPFSTDAIKQLSTHGITLLFDVPKVGNGVRGFDQMILVARQFADSLKGTMVDDNLKRLNDDGIAKIKQQLAAIYAKMDARGVPAGGQRALRLFS
jgi:FtsZ-interacting cell division protein ZipA